MGYKIKLYIWSFEVIILRWEFVIIILEESINALCLVNRSCEPMNIKWDN